jgi:hypothetical protein
MNIKIENLHYSLTMALSQRNNLIVSRLNLFGHEYLFIIRCIRV